MHLDVLLKPTSIRSGISNSVAQAARGVYRQARRVLDVASLAPINSVINRGIRHADGEGGAYNLALFWAFDISRVISYEGGDAACK